MNKECKCYRCKIDKEAKRNPTRMPEYTPTFKEISCQMKINAEIIMKEISDHVDKEIKRLKNMTLPGNLKEQEKLEIGVKDEI